MRLLLTSILLFASPAAAEPFRLVLDPAATEIRFTLGARLHTVRGSFALASGEIAFDPETGAASGEVRVDARSGDTGIDRRDRVMHEEVLDSAQHALLVLRPERVEVSRREGDELAGTLVGRFEVRGAGHPVAQVAECTLTGANIRVSYDGVDPTSSLGIILVPGQYTVTGADVMLAAKGIRDDSTSATWNCILVGN